MALLFLAGGLLAYAIYKQKTTEPTYEDIIHAKNEGLAIGGYNPYVLNQYVEWKDRMFSADVNENDIYAKPAERENGIYGIPEEHIKLNPVDVKVVVNTRENLNL
jgi:hypothetical protein